MKKTMLISVMFTGLVAVSSAHAGALGSGGVKESYNAGSKSSGGQTMYRVNCNSGGGGTVFQKSDGYWYDSSGSNYGNSYRNLSLSDFARKACS
ncbi:hypothetical protein [Nitrincola sp. MINF-07-Sa-05]|uniref:hypothetical protein n=1 Tax=Nitrincola salilacus TaxID=3400273 RepID=UPI0039180F28